MKKVILFFLLAVVVLSGCSSDDNKAATPVPALSGSWSLVNVSGSIAGTSTDFPEGTIVWTFNNGNVAVVNNNPADGTAEDFFETGTYPYVFTVAEVSTTCTHSLKVSQLDLGCVSQNQETLTIAQVEADGYVLTFKRVMENVIN